MNLNIPESEKTPLVLTLLEIINEQRKEIEALKEEILKFKKETIKPKPIDKPIEVEAFGTVIPVRTQTLSARVSSQIVYISPRLIPGSVVKKGELLIELDDTDFRLALKKSRSNVENAKLQLSQEVENQKSAMFEFSMADQNVSEAQKRYILRYPHVEAAKANLEAQKAALKRADRSKKV